MQGLGRALFQGNIYLDDITRIHILKSAKWKISLKSVMISPLRTSFKKTFPTSFSFIFGLYKQTMHIFQQINVKMTIHFHVMGFKPLQHKSSPITAWPGPLLKLFLNNLFFFTRRRMKVPLLRFTRQENAPHDRETRYNN